MNNKEKYNKVFESYYKSELKDNIYNQMGNARKSIRRNTVRKWVFAVCSVVLILSGTTLTAAAAGWISLADIFKIGFHDLTTGELVEADFIQELDVINENDDFTLKLIAFTGDTETHIAMFELIPKKDMERIKEIRLTGQTFSPLELENGSYEMYMPTGMIGYELTYDDDKNAYYFSYQLPPHWVKDLDDDIILRILGVGFFSNTGSYNYTDCDMLYRFTPDRAMLKQAYKVEVNETITKEVYDNCYFTDDYDNPYAYRGEIIAPTSISSLQITDVIFSEYKTEVNVLFLDKEITEERADVIWNQFTKPRFLTNHYGEDNLIDVLTPVENEKRIRLFVDDVEIEDDEEALFLPIKNYKAENYVSSIRLKGIDYEQADNIEIHFGDRIISLK